MYLWLRKKALGVKSKQEPNIHTQKKKYTVLPSHLKYTVKTHTCAIISRIKTYFQHQLPRKSKEDDIFKRENSRKTSDYTNRSVIPSGSNIKCIEHRINISSLMDQRRTVVVCVATLCGERPFSTTLLRRYCMHSDRHLRIAQFCMICLCLLPVYLCGYLKSKSTFSLIFVIIIARNTKYTR